MNAPTAPKLHFESVDDNATVYLNGQKLAQHNGWDDPFDVDLAPAWKAGGANVGPDGPAALPPVR